MDIYEISNKEREKLAEKFFDVSRKLYGKDFPYNSWQILKDASLEANNFKLQAYADVALDYGIDRQRSSKETELSIDISSNKDERK